MKKTTVLAIIAIGMLMGTSSCCPCQRSHLYGYEYGYGGPLYYGNSYSYGFGYSGYRRHYYNGGINGPAIYSNPSLPTQAYGGYYRHGGARYSNPSLPTQPQHRWRR